MSHKSPFLILRDFISPLQCEDMVSRLKHVHPNMDQSGKPTVSYKGNRLSEIRLEPEINQIIPDMEGHYGFKHKTLTPMTFEWYPSDFAGQKAGVDGYVTMGKRGKSLLWNKIKDYDFTGILFLNDYNDSVNFDERFEVRGGKLEFPTHDFGFNPERGTMVIFPCRPNFIHAVSPVEAGSLNIMRLNFIATDEYNYDMDNFPGGYKEWFSSDS